MGYEDYNIGPILLALAVGLLTRSTLFRYLPYTVWLLLGGMIIGIIFIEKPSTLNEGLQKSTDNWINLNPKILMTVFIPVLVFVSAWSVHGHLLHRQVWPVIWLAFPAVIFSALLTGTLIKYAMVYDWGWYFCFLLGSILSLTDPVATVSLLKELGVSEVISTLIETVSLFNDGSALVLFHIFLVALEGHAFSAGEIPVLFIRFVLGGAALGFTLGLLAAQVLRVIVNDVLAEITLTLVMCYSTWILAENTAIHVSGVIAVVIMGLTLSRHGRPFVSPSVQQSMADFWYLLDFIANTVVFFIVGLIIIGQTTERRITITDWGQLLLLYILLYAVRLLSVVLSWPLLQRTGYGMNWKQGALIVHSGLRGSMALILALIADGIEEIDREDRDKLVFFVCGISVMTLVLQGSTTKLLVQTLGLDRSTEAELLTFSRACFSLEQSLQEDVARFKEDDFLAEADWTAVWRYLPIFTPEMYWLRIIGGHIQLAQGEVVDVIQAAKKALQKSDSTKITLDIELGETIDQESVETGFLETSWVKKLLCHWGQLRKQYPHLPSHLRAIWQHHAKAFGGSAYSISHLELEGLSLRAFLESRMTDAFKRDWANRTSDLNSENEDYNWGIYTAHLNVGLSHESIHNQSLHHISRRRSSEMNHLNKSLHNRSKHRDFSVPNHRASSFWLDDQGHTEHDVVDKDQLKQWRIHYLEVVRAHYKGLFYQGRLTGSGLKILNDSVNEAQHKVGNGKPINSWSYIAEKYYQPSFISRVKNAFKRKSKSRQVLKGPLKWLEMHLFHRRLIFVMHVAWNFIVSHRAALRVWELSNPDITHAEKITNEHEKQVELASGELFQLLKDSPPQARSVKTQIASRTMLFAAQELINRQYHDGRITHMEFVHMSQGVTAGLKSLSFHPIIEKKPHILHILARIEFLHLLNTSQLKYIVNLGLVKSKEYVGPVELLKQGELGGRAGYGCYYIVRGSVLRCEEESAPKNIVNEEKDIEFKTNEVFDQNPHRRPTLLARGSVTMPSGFNGGTMNASASQIMGLMGSVRASISSIIKAETDYESIALRYGGGDQIAGKLMPMGMLIGITDALLNVPNHVTYVTGAYASLLFLDIPGFLEVSESMKELKLGIWTTLAAHLLARCTTVNQINQSQPYSLLSLRQLHQILACAEFFEVDKSTRVSSGDAMSPMGPEMVPINHSPINTRESRSADNVISTMVIYLPPKSQAIILKGSAKEEENFEENDLEPSIQNQIQWTSLGRAPIEANSTKSRQESPSRLRFSSKFSAVLSPRISQNLENNSAPFPASHRAPLIVENKAERPLKIRLFAHTKAFVLK